MKTLTSISIILGFVALTAGSVHAKCERLELYDLSNLQASMEQDLMSNAWRSNLLGTPSNLYFQEDGLLVAIPEGSGKITTYIWSLHAIHGSARLSLMTPEMDMAFWIAPTCNGLSASSDEKSVQMFISSEEQFSDARHNFLKRQLSGIWHYRNDKSTKSHKAGFSISLHDDGTFSLKTSPDKYHSTNEGVWQITADGQYLILSTYGFVGQKKQYISEAIAVRSVDFEDMVIDARTLPRALEAYEGRQPLYVSKARA